MISTFSKSSHIYIVVWSFNDFVSLYLSSLPVAHPRQFVFMQGYRTKLLRTPPGSSMCSAYRTVTWDLGLKSRPKKQLVSVRLTSLGMEPTTLSF